MKIKKYNHPVLFYTLSTLIPWFFWFLAAFLSHLGPDNAHYISIKQLLNVFGTSETALATVFMFAGIVSPMILAFALMIKNPELKNDLFDRLFKIRNVKPIYLLMTFFLMPASILLAQAISIFFGHSLNQFSLAESFSFSAGLVPAWAVLFLAPLFEEMAWHSYGTDCLRRRFSLFTTSIMFGLFWIIWHVPLSFIKDYYQSNLVETGWLYSLNFAVSLIPYVLLMNWLYYKTNRNIMVAVVFHITAGFFNEIFATHPDSKVIQTVLLLGLSIVLVIREKDFFFDRNHIGEKLQDYPITEKRVGRNKQFVAPISERFI